MVWSRCFRGPTGIKEGRYSCMKRYGGGHAACDFAMFLFLYLLLLLLHLHHVRRVFA